MENETSFEEFKIELAGINASGNPNEAFSLIYQLTRQEENITYDNERLTYRIIMDKYKEYISWWNRKYANSDERYIPKDKKKHDLYDFLVTKKYNEMFVDITPNADRDPWLFGDDGIKNMHLRVLKFKESINSNKQRIHGEN